MKLRKGLVIFLAFVLITCSMSGCSKPKTIRIIVTPIAEEVTGSPVPTAEEITDTPTPTATLVPANVTPAPTPSEDSILIDTQVDQSEREGELIGYYYNQLTKKQKNIYLSLCSYYEEIQDRYIEFTNTNEKDIKRVIECVDKEQSFFSVCDYQLCIKDDTLGVKILSFKRKISKKQKEKIEKKKEEILSEIREEGKGKDEIIREIYNWCTKNIKYDETKSKNHIRDLYGALINKESVCEGYARTFYYLCNQVGINCIYVEGQKHAWNYVYLNDWYAIDVTWGEVNTSQYLLEGKEFMEDENHIPKDSNYFTLPTLAEDSFYPKEEVQNY